MLADEDIQLIGAMAERSASESGVVIGPSTLIDSRNDSRIHDNDNPLFMSWLNQSASPEAVAETVWFNNHDQYSCTSKSEEILNQEKKDIEVFKNIHIGTASEPASMPTFYPGADDGSDPQLRAEIYYRNVKHRYPLLPHLLIRRLVIAHFNPFNRFQLRQIIARIGSHFTAVCHSYDETHFAGGRILTAKISFYRKSY